MSAYFHITIKKGWQLGVSLSAAALRAAADKLTPEINRNATAQTVNSNRRFQTGKTSKTRSDRKARREKASALTRLRIAFFLAAGGLSLQGCGMFYLLFRPFPFGIVDNSEKIS